MIQFLNPWHRKIEVLILSTTAIILIIGNQEIIDTFFNFRLHFIPICIFILEILWRIISWLGIPRAIRLTNNLKKKVKIIIPTSQDDTNQVRDITMNMELKLLNSSDFFNIEKPHCFHSGDSLKGYSAIILGYVPNMKDFLEVYNQATSNKIPLIIYTYNNGQAIQGEHLEKLKKYNLHAIAGTPLNLINTTFTTLAVIPHE